MFIVLHKTTYKFVYPGPTSHAIKVKYCLKLQIFHAVATIMHIVPHVNYICCLFTTPALFALSLDKYQSTRSAPPPTTPTPTLPTTPASYGRKPLSEEEMDAINVRCTVHTLVSLCVCGAVV